MRVAFDHQIFSWQRYGGVSRYFYELAQHLARLGETEVTVVAPLYVNEYLRNTSEIHVVGRYIPQIPKAGRLLQVLNAPAVRREFRKVRPNVVHETYYYERRLAPKEVPVVATVHDMIYEKFPHCYPAWDRTRYRKREVVRRADHVICVSENTKKDVIDILDVPEDRISVIHHGYALTTVPSEHRPSVPSEPYLLFVGLRGGYKNFRLLLDAYASSRALRDNFRIVCFGGGRLTRSELDQMNELNLPRNAVVQLGGDDQRLAAIYQHAAALVYPSLYEGFGIPPLEAMAHGCPVICSRTSSLPEVCGNAASYFDPTDLDDIKQVIEHVLGSSSSIEDLRRRGFEQIRLFSWETCAVKTLQVYEAVVGAGLSA